MSVACGTYSSTGFMELRVMSVILFLVLSVINIAGTDSRSKCSRIDKSFKRVLSRKKRLVVFPKSATVLLTPSFTKALITGYPRGLVTSTEIDIYHPLPETVDDWRPKIFDKPSTESPPVMKKDPLMETDFSLHNQNNVWIPPSGWQEKSKLDFLWSLPKEKKWFSQMPNKQWIYDNTPDEIIHSEPHYWRNTHRFGQIRDHSYNPEWMNLRSNRERREIFDNIENAASLLGFDFKSCILRTICETKHFLLPPGKSFVQDVIRLLFTFPAEDDYNGGHSNDTKSSEEDCHARYKNSCPISIAEFLLHGDRII